MKIESSSGRLEARVGRACAPEDIDALQQAIDAAGPLSQVRIDFSSLQRCEYPALMRLADVLSAVDNCEIALTGITAHQARILRYLGFDPGIHPNQALLTEDVLVEP
jgi:hypothetical protein